MIRIYYLRQDIIFKSIFKDKKRMKRLIEEALRVKINKVIQLNTEREINNVHEKKKILDIIVDTDQGIINIELNNNYNRDLECRNFIYFCKLISSTIKTNEAYRKIPKHIQINITWNLQRYHSEDISNFPKLTYGIAEEHSNIKKHPYFKIIEINMDYYEKLCYNSLKEEDKFFKLLSSTNIDEMKSLSEGDEVMEEITKKVEDYNIDPDIINKIELENDYEKLQNGLLEDAKFEGIKQTAKNMLEENIDSNIISKVTGLTLDEIEDLK